MSSGVYNPVELLHGLVVIFDMFQYMVADDEIIGVVICLYLPALDETDQKKVRLKD